MASQNGARIVQTGNLTVHITAVIVDAVSRRWTISAHGMFCYVEIFWYLQVLGTF
jgi:hypothetical protein